MVIKRNILGPRYDSPSTSTLVQKPPNLPRPQFNGNRLPPRMPGPCFNCFEMGHLKAACPKLATTYPFKSSVDVYASYVCMCESVCICMAKGDPESVSSLKRGDDTSPRSVDLLDIKSPEPAEHWRGQGLRVVLYLDDGIVAADGKAAAARASAKVRSDLRKAGLVEHTAKRNWNPSQKVVWLGFNLDLEAGLISIPGEKIVALKTQLQEICKETLVRARKLASVIGKIMSMALAIGPVSRLMTRSMYALLNTRDFWCQNLPISDVAKFELDFWLNQVDNLNGRGIWHSPSAVRIVYTDASDTGYAGYTVEHGYHIAHDLWSEEEVGLSSTWRELRAVRLALESLVGKLQGHRVRWFTDNQNVVTIITSGSRKPDLQKEAIAIYSFALSNGVHIEPEWIPRDENQKADLLSRQLDQDDWSIHPNIFEGWMRPGDPIQ